MGKPDGQKVKIEWRKIVKTEYALLREERR